MKNRKLLRTPGVLGVTIAVMCVAQVAAGEPVGFTFLWNAEPHFFRVGFLFKDQICSDVPEVPTRREERALLEPASAATFKPGSLKELVGKVGKVKSALDLDVKSWKSKQATFQSDYDWAVSSPYVDGGDQLQLDIEKVLTHGNPSLAPQIRAITDAMVNHDPKHYIAQHRKHWTAFKAQLGVFSGLVHGPLKDNRWAQYFHGLMLWKYYGLCTQVDPKEEACVKAQEGGERSPATLNRAKVTALLEELPGVEARERFCKFKRYAQARRSVAEGEELSGRLQSRLSDLKSVQAAWNAKVDREVARRTRPAPAPQDLGTVYAVEYPAD